MENKDFKTKLQELKETLLDIENKASDIFTDVMDRKNKSREELLEKTKENDELYNKLLDTIISFKAIVDNEGKIVNKRRSRYTTMLVGSTVAFICLAPLAIPVLPAIPVGVFVYSLKEYIKNHKRAISICEQKDEFDNISSLTNDISTNIQNNRVRLESMIKELPDGQEILFSSKEANLILSANTIIQNCIDNDMTLEDMDISEEILSTMKKLLKSDLNSSEEDVSVLLKQAKEKVQSETITKKLD